VNQDPQEIAFDIFSKYLENNIRNEIIINQVQKKDSHDHFIANLKMIIK